MADDPLRMMSSEFDLWGVKFEHRFRGSGHIEIRWQVSPYKPVRSHIVAKTPSDHRWFLNERARIRQLFRQDGLTLKEEVKKQPQPVQIPQPVGKLEKALQIPQPVETDRELLRSLRTDIADLTDLVLDLTMRLDQLVATPGAPVAAPAAEPAPPAVEAPAKKQQPFRGVDIVSCMSDGWNSIEAIAKAADIPIKIAHRKLYYLQRKGVLETSKGRCRRKLNLELVTRRKDVPKPMRRNRSFAGEA
ncbi:hypothetical protein AAFX91_14055 [Bradyrhizobium sp. 31Argb]|uniref:hypothetical protein n=1 Tax=Bradyrhizobium sp. 31Argb TaxID=3141247 RepID=UPI0037486EA6